MKKESNKFDKINLELFINCLYMPPSISQLKEERDYLRHQLERNGLTQFFSSYLRGWYFKLIMFICITISTYYKRYEVWVLVLIPLLIFMLKRQSVKRRFYRLSAEIEKMKRIKYGS